MRRFVAFAILALVSLVPFGVSSPIDGTYGKKNDISSQPWRTKRTFQGGERAAAFAMGDRADDEMIGKLHIKVFDANDKLVAEDAGVSNLVGDFVGVTWYPPRTAEYRIEVYTTHPNKVWVAIK